MPLNELGNAHARNAADPFDNMGWTPAGKIGETIIIGGELFVHYRLRCLQLFCPYPRLRPRLGLLPRLDAGK